MIPYPPRLLLPRHRKPRASGDDPPASEIAAQWAE